MSRYRGPRWANASTDQRLLLLSGVPSKYWEPGNPVFTGVSIPAGKTTIALPAGKQRAAYQTLLNNSELQTAGLIGVGSRDGDHNAMHAAVDLIRGMLLSREPSTPKAHIIDHGRIPLMTDTDSDGRNIGIQWWANAEEAAVVLHHNLLAEECDSSRVQRFRDIVVNFSESTHIVVVAGMAYDFLVGRASVWPDVLFHVDGTRRSAR